MAIPAPYHESIAGRLPNAVSPISKVLQFPDSQNLRIGAWFTETQGSTQSFATACSHYGGERWESPHYPSATEAT